MTGKEEKVYSGQNNMAIKAQAPGQAIAVSSRKYYDVPELVYNLDLLIEMTEEEIVRNDRQLKHLKVGARRSSKGIGVFGMELVLYGTS